MFELPEPVHPAIVHFPIALGIILPLFAILLSVAIAREWMPKRAWWVVVVLAGLTFAGAYVAVETGEETEEVVEEVVSHDFIHDHEEMAERFLLLSGITFGASLLLFFLPGRGMRIAAGAGTSLLAAVAAGIVGYTGYLGGELVYVHGAADAYVPRKALDEAPDIIDEDASADGEVTASHEHEHEHGDAEKNDATGPEAPAPSGE